MNQRKVVYHAGELQLPETWAIPEKKFTPGRDYPEGKKTLITIIDSAWTALGSNNFKKAEELSAHAKKFRDKGGIWPEYPISTDLEDVENVSKLLAEKPLLIKPDGFLEVNWQYKHRFNDLRRAIAYLNYSLYTCPDPTPGEFETQFLKWHRAMTLKELPFTGVFVSKTDEIRKKMSDWFTSADYHRLREEDPKDFSIQVFRDVVQTHALQEANRRMADLSMNFFLYQDGFQPVHVSREDYLQFINGRKTSEEFFSFFREKIKPRK